MKNRNSTCVTAEQSSQQLNKCLDKAAAALVLADEIYDVRIALNKVQYIMNEVVEEFFEFEDVGQKKLEILWEYPRNAAKANIVLDYLNEICRTIKSISVEEMPKG